jgi:CubicO group peptidase (beta-lactamase class C family)
MTPSHPERRKFIMAAAGLAAAACVSPPSPGRMPSSRFDWTLHKPTEVGMSEAGLADIRGLMRQLIDTNVHTGNIVAIARFNKLVMFEAQGVRNIETGAPMRTDDIFRMMSSTKVITAVAVMMLAEEGRISIDHPVRRFIPEFGNIKVSGADGKLAPPDRDVTIRHLLTHTSGLNLESAAAKLQPIERAANDTLATFVPRYGNAVLDFQPGSKWAYSGLPAFDVLLYIVQHVTGIPADTFVRERILEPLEMRDTFFNVPASKAERVLPLYARVDSSWRRQQALFSGASAYTSGAGGLFSTAHDFMQFEQMLYNRGELNGRRVLRSVTVDTMASNHVGDLYASSFGPYTVGMGFGLGVKVAVDPSLNTFVSQGRGSFGWSGAYGTETWVDPDNDLSVVYFVQQPSIPALVDFQRTVCRAVGDADA